MLLRLVRNKSIEVGFGKVAKQLSSLRQKKFGQWEGGVRSRALSTTCFIMTSAIRGPIGQPIATPSSC